MRKFLLLSLMLLTSVGQAALGNRTERGLKEIIVENHRSIENRERDQYRHPVETLSFFGISDTQTVVEIWPSSGWYTEILAPLLREHGKYYVANFDENNPATKDFQKKIARDFRAKLAENPKLYDRINITALEAPKSISIAPPATVDLIVTFRNVHNWVKDGQADAVFAAFFKALKSGGTLGVVEHRARPGTSLNNMIKTGYMTEKKVIELAKHAGFRFVAESAINNNPKDSTDHPNGVWSLPPTLRGGEESASKFLAIGESDRMTLRFLKP